MMNGRPTKRPKAPRGPFKELRKGLGGVFTSKAFLMATSLVIALFFWSALVASDGTLTRQKVFSNVAVGVSGESSLKSRGYIVMDDLDTLIPGVRMTVEVTQANYDRVSGTPYNPHIDLSKIKGEGSNEIAVAFSSQLYGPVISCEPSSVTLNVERYITRRIPVVLETKGKPDGYYLDSAKTDPSTLTVSGPQSLISQVARAVATLDASVLSGERMSDRMTLDIRLQSYKGETIESDLIEVTNQSVITRTVVAETELLPMRAIPLQLDEFVTGVPAVGYEIEEIIASVESIDVAAAQEVLDAMSVFTTEHPLDVEGATADVSGYVRLKRPSGMENSVPYDVAVTVKIREAHTQRTFRNIAVEVEGLDNGYNATISRDHQLVQLRAPYSFVSDLREQDIRLYVDVSELDVGEHKVPVQISIDNAPDFTCALSSPEITVTITQK